MNNVITITETEFQGDEFFDEIISFSGKHAGLSKAAEHEFSRKDGRTTAGTEIWEALPGTYEAVRTISTVGRADRHEQFEFTTTHTHWIVLDLNDGGACPIAYSNLGAAKADWQERIDDFRSMTAEWIEQLDHEELKAAYASATWDSNIDAIFELNIAAEDGAA